MENELFKELVNKNVTVFLKTGMRFSGTLLCAGKDFLKLEDRFSGLKLISLDCIENVTRCK